MRVELQHVDLRCLGVQEEPTRAKRELEGEIWGGGTVLGGDKLPQGEDVSGRSRGPSPGGSRGRCIIQQGIPRGEAGRWEMKKVTSAEVHMWTLDSRALWWLGTREQFWRDEDPTSGARGGE